MFDKKTMDESGETIADLMTDGCNMSVTSLNKYLNQYKAAEEKTKNITKRLINLEEKLVIDIRCFYKYKIKQPLKSESPAETGINGCFFNLIDRWKSLSSQQRLPHNRYGSIRYPVGVDI